MGYFPRDKKEITLGFLIFPSNDEELKQFMLELTCPTETDQREVARKRIFLESLETALSLRDESDENRFWMTIRHLWRQYRKS